MTREPVSVLVLTRDEEGFIERLMASVAWADEIVVLDSESTDATRERARRAGAAVHVQPWLGWVEQKRRGAALARHDWILSLDADEIVTDELGRSVRDALACGPDPRDGFVVERREEFLGRLMPDARRRRKRDGFVRLFNRRHGDWDPARIVHEEIVCPGRLHKLDGALLHWRNYSIGRQLQTLGRNADLEAVMIEERGGRLLFGMTVKPVLRFAWLYVWSGWWRTGRRGFVFAGLQAFAEFLRHAQAWERRDVPQQRDPPSAVWSPASAPDAGAGRGADGGVAAVEARGAG